MQIKIPKRTRDYPAVLTDKITPVQDQKMVCTSTKKDHKTTVYKLREPCHVELVFKPEGPHLRACFGVKEPGFLIPVTDAFDATEKSQQFCRCVAGAKNERSKVKACAMEIGATGDALGGCQTPVVRSSHGRRRRHH